MDMMGINFVGKSLLVFLLCSLSSCSNSQNRKEQPSRSSQISLERYIEINKQLVGEEQKIIAQYLEEENLDMHTTETGLWYTISVNGAGDDIVKGKVVTLDYQIWLLDGTLCYSSANDGPKAFLVGQGGVESGLEEGILLLKKGSKATFIMPPHLAHGLLGDDDRIPSRAILRYEIEVIDVKNKNEN
jgi:FKBP-type peptidyl-prolyl cis-trans isomerase